MNLRIFKHIPPRKGNREQRGQGVVEFAMLAPILVLLLAGLVDFTNGYLTYVSLENAAREGAAYGAYPSGQGSICGRVQQALPSTISVECGNITTSYPAVTGNAGCPGDSAIVGCPIRVKVTYSLGIGGGVPLFFGAVFGIDHITLSPYVDMMILST